MKLSTAFPYAPALLLGLLSCTLLSATTIIVPAGLTAGEQYRLIFITADTYQATSTDINYYNGVVTAEANSVSDLAALDTSWYVVGSTATVNAIDNIGIDSGVPIYDLNGHEIASDAGTTGNGMFNSSGSLLTGLNTNENDGLITGYEDVWTGTYVNGVPGSHPPLGSASVTAGSSGTNSGFWIAHAEDPSTTENALYAISGVLTVPTPEPSTGFMAAIGAAALMLALWRRNRRNGRKAMPWFNRLSRTPGLAAMAAVLLAAIFTSGAQAAAVDYTIAFTLVYGDPGAPTSGSFAYDADAAIGSQFSNFLVTWDGIGYDLTSYANAPVSTGTDCGSNSADVFQLLSTNATCSTQGTNEPMWFGDANARQNGNLFEFVDSNTAGTSSLSVEESQTGREGGSNAAYGTWTIEPVGAPEPRTLAMMLAGGVLLALGKMRRSRA